MSLGRFRPVSVLITGANRGIGLEFVNQFLQLPSPPEHIFTTYRSPHNSEELLELGRSNTNVHTIQLDVADHDQLKDVVRQVSDRTDKLNLLINNAGVNIWKTLSEVSPVDMIKSFEINTVAPLMITQVFVPLLKRGASSATEMSCSRAAVVNISSRSASCELTTGTMYPYRASKAALNMVTRNCAVDLKSDRILIVALQPGWVKTEMGELPLLHESGWMEKQARQGGNMSQLTTCESVNGMMNVIARLEAKDSGCFIGYMGEHLPW